MLAKGNRLLVNTVFGTTLMQFSAVYDRIAGK